MLVILHIAPDDKFVDGAIASFERAAPNRNYLCVITEKDLPAFVTKSRVDMLIRPRAFSAHQWKHQIKKADFIVLHSLTGPGIQVAMEASSPVAWLGYGVDYYRLLGDYPTAYLLQHTRQLRASLVKSVTKRPVLREATNCIKLLLSITGIRKTYQLTVRQLLQDKITHFAPVLEPEYAIVSRSLNLPNFPEYIKFKFGVFGRDMPKLSDMSIIGNSILLGNSATYTNNHLDAMMLMMGKVRLNGRQIISPLSYGDPVYRAAIAERGSAMFGASFRALPNFMPLNEYRVVLRSASVAIMNHMRQQAIGNVIHMLFIGAQVFLREESVACAYLRDRGFCVGTMNQLQQGGTDCLDDFSEKDRMRNQDLAERHFSPATIDRVALAFVRTMRSA